jgi:MYXO-CTERM domain-containing protein
MKHVLLRSAAALASVAFACSASADEQPNPTSIHQEELRLHGLEPRPSRILPPLETLDGAVGPKRIVYGYLPYWTNNLATIRWSALTHVAWFSLGISQAGNITIKHDWPDKEAVDVAHKAGVLVDLTFTLFDGAGIAALCNSPTARANGIKNMIDEMEAGGADGISIDFEFVPGSAREGFVAFVSELRAALTERGHPMAGISIAGPTTDWSGGLDMPALMAKADSYFFMGYGYFWGGSTYAGPTGMLRVSKEWASKTQLSSTRTIAEFSAKLPAEDRKKLLWGVPYYGREWTTESNALGSKVVENVSAVTYSQAKADLAGQFAEPLWDEGTKTPWYRWQEGGTWHQVYFDDAKSLKAKYELALAQGLGGVGIWALNYDTPHQELWDVLEQTFAEEPALAPGHRLAPIAITSLPFTDAQTTVDGPSHYFNFYSCAPDKPEYGREWVYAIELCQAGTLSAHIPAYADHDPDVHILSAPEQEACIARGHTDASVAVKPGRYYVVVDTFASKGVEQEGSYELTVDFAAEAGSSPCAEHLACDGGTCVCPTAGEIDCAGACVDTATDATNCGACGTACDEGRSCVAGACEKPDVPPELPPSEPPAAEEGVGPTAGAGCGCTMPGRTDSEPYAAVLVALGIALARRRSRE